MVDPRVQQHLESLDIAYTIRHHRDFAAEIRTPADFADALGYPPARVTKAVVCQSNSKTEFALLVIPSDSRIDFKRASQACGAGRLHVADPEELARLTGYPRHGVSPLGLDSTIAVVVDRELLDYESVLVGAGVAGVEIELSPVDLIDATHAVVDGIAVPAQRSLD